MIASPSELRLALTRLSEAYEAIASIREEHPNASREWLSVMEEGFVDHARGLQREIDEYLGMTTIDPESTNVPLGSDQGAA